MSTNFKSVDEYIASQLEAVQGLLKRVRITIRRVFYKSASKR